MDKLGRKIGDRIAVLVKRYDPDGILASECGLKFVMRILPEDVCQPGELVILECTKLRKFPAGVCPPDGEWRIVDE